MTSIYLLNHGSLNSLIDPTKLSIVLLTDNVVFKDHKNFLHHLLFNTCVLAVSITLLKLTSDYSKNQASRIKNIRNIWNPRGFTYNP